MDKVVKRNAFLARPENLLLAMICDVGKHIWVLAYKKIMKTRQERETKKKEGSLENQTEEKGRKRCRSKTVLEK